MVKQPPWRPGLPRGPDDLTEGNEESWAPQQPHLSISTVSVSQQISTVHPLWARLCGLGAAPGLEVSLETSKHHRGWALSISEAGKGREEGKVAVDPVHGSNGSLVNTGLH